jgi:hypothetical protein
MELKLASEWQRRMSELQRDYERYHAVERNVVKSVDPCAAPISDLLDRLALEPEHATSWDDVQQWFASFPPGWCYRGQANAIWNLKTSFDRYVWKTVEASSGGTQITSFGPMEGRLNERSMLEHFQRDAHQHLALPVDSVVDWLAWMQHYGTPTRLLDWTRSPLVALYFALGNGQPPQTDAAIWAIDLEWFVQRSMKMLQSHQPPIPHLSELETDDSYVNRIIFADGNPPIIVPARPVQINNRMKQQEGLLLLNLSDEYQFYFSLLMMLLNSPVIEGQVVSKLIIKNDKYPNFVEELHKRSIDHSSLFPGPDELGVFSECLKKQLEGSLANQIEAFRKSIVEQIESRKRHSG